MLLKMTGEMHNIFWEKEEDKKKILELLIQRIRQLIWANYSYSLNLILRVIYLGDKKKQVLLVDV